MLKIKCDAGLVNFKGKALKNEEQDITVGEVISSVLASQTDNPTLGWILGKKFATEKEVEIKAEEVVFIKKCLTTQKVGWNSIVIGQILEIIGE